jgi:predicted RND superfamily exporter protein
MDDSIILRAVRGLGNAVFGARSWLVGLYCLATFCFAIAATQAHFEGGLEKHVPADHPFITTAKKYEAQFGAGTILLVALEAKHGTIFTEPFFDELDHVADDLFYFPGVDRGHLAHIFSPNVYVLEITELGFHKSTTIPRDFKPTPEGFAEVKANLLKGGFVGQLVSEDFTSALIAVPLFGHESRTGVPLDYLGFAHRLETDIKQKYEAKYPDVRIRMTGVVRAAGEIADGAAWIAGFFLIALLITGFLLYRVSHHWWLTAAALLCSLSAVIWQIGLVTLFGYGIDLYSVFIPFLVLSIGVSHGVQMILSTGQLVAAGEDAYEAARHSFRRLFLPGSVALITGVITFLTITTIAIPVIRELAVTATIGIGALAFTNLIWLPLLVSYARIDRRVLARMQVGLDRRERFWHLLAILVRPRSAVMVSVSAAILAVGAAIAAQNLVVGDLNQGVPELRPDSRFNQDTLYILGHFGLGVDAVTVFATGPADSCLVKERVQAVDQFVDSMRFVPGVHGVVALPGVMKFIRGFFNESNIRWQVLSHDRRVLGQSTGGWNGNRLETNGECSVMPVQLYLNDHKAATLTGVIRAVEEYKTAHPDLPIDLELAGGSGGQAAATNEVVAAAQMPMLALVYLAVIVICGVTFRSVRAVICIIVPLALVSLVANGAMALLGIGLKVSTLPVAALGVGIGVDYGIYKFSRLSHYLVRGMSMQDAYIQTLRETGSAVIFTGLTLSVGVVTWVFSPLQFQADMGLLLTLMFFMNMVGAIILLPALIGIMQLIKPQRVEDLARCSVLHHV